jgi:hypothetical protein
MLLWLQCSVIFDAKADIAEKMDIRDTDSAFTVLSASKGKTLFSHKGTKPLNHCEVYAYI